MSDIAPNKLIETLTYACSAVRSAKDKLKYCESQITKEQHENITLYVTDTLRLTELRAKKEALMQELELAYEKRTSARAEINELFASLRG